LDESAVGVTQNQDSFFPEFVAGK